ncbi:MAG: di-heme-cytochrome C peroxidase, partial [Sneathiella sp.]
MKIYLTLITSLSLAGTFSLFEVNQAAADTCATTGIPENRPFDGSLSGEITLCQNWTETEQQAFWFTGQGSLILPYNWFLALETTRSNTGAIEKLRSPDVMNGYRYLPQLPTELNPDGLPIGFTKDEPRGNSAYETVSAQWLGFTCAACHTGQVEFGPVKALVDGAPAMADFEGFFTEMAAALRATLEDTEKFDRFSKDVFALNQARAPAEPTDAGQLKHQLMQLTADREAWNRRNSGAHPYGHARLDAIGAIFNEIEWAARKDNSPLPAGKADAPVSYPFIWDTSQHDRVQWNGSVANAGLGAISRNMGEVLGVFGALELTTSRLSRLGHRNSINIANLGKLETLIWSLQSPKWSDMQSLIEASDLPNADKDLWTIDPDLAAIGAKLFNGQNTETAAFACASCHTPVKRDDPNRRVKATMIRLAKVGTDTTMAENFRTRQTDAHDLKKLFKSYWGFLSKYKRFEEEAVSAEMLKYSVVGVLTRELFNQ